MRPSLVGRRVHLRRGHPVLSRILCPGRRADRGLRLFQRASLRLGGHRRADLHGLHELCRRRHAALAELGLRVERRSAVRPGRQPGDNLPVDLCLAFGSTWRIVLAVIAFWAGEFVNAFVMAKMKILTGGKHLWSRTIGSTVFGQAVDSALFYPIAFIGISGKPMMSCW
ncbi:MAG: VUT family protein [Polyangiaceae bacterium]